MAALSLRRGPVAIGLPATEATMPTANTPIQPGKPQRSGPQTSLDVGTS
jgi:hypothetical protein